MVITEALFEERIQHLVKLEKKWVIGLSGGADSLCLILLANVLAKAHGIELFACIVDHKLRIESSDEILPILDLLGKAGIRHKVFTWHHDDDIGGSIERKARDARYGFLYGFCEEVGAGVLVTAHHAMDQWETFFMRLSHGSSLRGLSCIKPVSRCGNVLLVRPLLDFTPSDIRETLADRFGIWTYVNDPSNSDPRFERVRWRNAHQQLAKNHGLDIMNVNKTITRLQNANDCLDKMANNATQEIFDGTYIKMSMFSELHIELRMRVLHTVLNAVSARGPHIISYDLLHRVSHDICAPGFVATNLSGVVMRKDRTKNVRCSQEERGLSRDS
ncbi:MAG: tRNA lysidine(34) synthetase TilS [Holosporales bacterium]|jgi:tRNA(Ile)-lysidine synthase|nr:tRNA lysidine(34) synthetase TilS [Holosporales bacterium]